MDWAITYLKYLPLFWISLLVFYGTGRIIIAIIKKFTAVNFEFHSTSRSLFASMAVGMTFSVLIFSIVFTAGKTVNLLIIYVAALFLWTLKKNSGDVENGRINSSSRSVLIELFIYGSLIFSLFAFEIIRTEDWSSVLRAQHLVDWGLYSVHTQTMAQTGQENTYNVHNILDMDYHGANPYHYFELWLGSLIVKFFPQTLRIYLFAMVIYPMICLFALIACWIWLEEFGVSSRYLRFLAFLCLFTAGWFFLNSQFIQSTGFLRLLVGSFDDLNAFLIDVPKRAVVFSFLLGGLLFIKNRHIRSGFILFLALPIFSVDSIPAVFGGTLLFITFWRRHLSTQDRTFIFVTFAIFAGLFFAFYKLFGNHVISLYSLSDVIKQAFSLSNKNIVLPFMFAARAFIASFALYSFHLLLLGVLRRSLTTNQLKPVLTLLFCMFISAIAGWSFLYSYIESIQFFAGFLTALQTFLLVLFIPLIWNVPRSKVKIVFIAYVLVTISFNFHATYVSTNTALPYSKQYLDAINQYQPISKVGVSIRGKEDFSKQWVERHVITHTLGDDYLIFMSNYLKPVEIGVLDSPDASFRQRPKTLPFLNISVDFDSVDADRNRMMKESSIFFRFYNEIKKDKPAISIEETQRQFIELHHIDWAILSKNVPVSDVLKTKVDRIVVDPVSGEKFLILKR